MVNKSIGEEECAEIRTRRRRCGESVQRLAAEMGASEGTVSNHARGVRGCNHDPDVVGEPIQDRYRMPTNSSEPIVSFGELADTIGDYRAENPNLTASRLAVEELIGNLAAEERNDA